MRRFGSKAIRAKLAASAAGAAERKAARDRRRRAKNEYYRLYRQRLKANPGELPKRSRLYREVA